MEKKVKPCAVKIFIKDNPGKSASGRSRPKYQFKVEYNEPVQTDLSVNDIPGGMDAWIQEMITTGFVIIPSTIKQEGGAWESTRLTVNGDRQADGELTKPYNADSQMSQQAEKVLSDIVSDTVKNVTKLPQVAAA